MSDEHRPGGEHCPKCGYRHEGRCAEEEIKRLKAELEQVQAQARFTPHQCCEFLDGECAERRRCLYADNAV